MKRAFQVLAISALALAILAVVLALKAHTDVKLLRVDHEGPYGPVGIFSLRHSHMGLLHIYGFGRPTGGVFDPDFIEYQVQSDGVWRDLPILYCGTGARTYPLFPHRTYILRVPLYPLTNASALARVAVAGRVGTQSYWSAPFDAAVLR